MGKKIVQDKSKDGNITRDEIKIRNHGSEEILGNNVISVLGYVFT